MNGLTPEQSESLRKQLQVLRANYGVKLREKVEVIRRLWRECRETPAGSGRQELLKVLHRHTHSLAGSGATFGFAAAGEAARQAEVVLKAVVETNAPFDESAISAVEEALLVLEREVGQESGVDEEQEAESARQAEEIIIATDLPANHKVYVFTESAKDPQWLSALSAYGYEVRLFRSPPELVKAAAADTPSAIVAECNQAPLNVVGEGLPLSSAIGQINEAQDEQPVPVVWCCSQDDLTTRLQTVRMGGAGFLRQPVDVDVLLLKLHELTQQVTQEPFRILVVDDEPALARLYALVLRQAGMTVHVVTDPLLVMEPLVEFKPDLVLMDVYMPGCSGIELAAVIRQQQAFLDIPIIFLSIERDVAQQLEAMRQGGDDFLVKPLQPRHLVSAVSTRARRARGLRQLMQRDSLTGLWSHASTREHLGVELDRAKRLGHPLALALLNIDHFAAINIKHGHAAGDHVLRSLARLLDGRLRQTDVVGRFGGDEFAVIMNNSSSAAAQRVIEGMRATFASFTHAGNGSEFRVSFSAGIATSPPHGKCEALIEAATQALNAAKTAGRNKTKLCDDTELWSKREPLT